MFRITKWRLIVLAAVVAAAVLIACVNDIRRSQHIEAVVARLRSADPATKDAALAELSALTDPDEIPILVRHLSDDDDALRQDLTVILVHIGEPAVNPLIANIVRFYSARRTVWLFIQERVKREATWEIERREGKALSVSGRVLCQIGSPSIKPLGALANNRNPFIRSAVVRTLGVIPSPLAVAPLAAAMADGDYNVRAWAVTLLATRPEDEAVAALDARLTSADESTRYWAGLEFSRLNDRKAIPLLIWEMTNAGEARWRRDAAYALGPFDEADVVAALEQALTDNDSDVRIAALKGLAAMESEDAKVAFRQASGGSDATLRKEASQIAKSALGTPAPPGQTTPGVYEGRVKPLMPLFDRVDAQARRSILLALCQDAGDSRVVDFLLPIVVSAREDASVRAMAVWALRFSRDDRAVPALIAALSDRAPEVRDVAERALAKMPPQQTVKPLKKALEDAGDDNRETLRRVIEDAGKQTTDSTPR